VQWRAQPFTYLICFCFFDFSLYVNCERVLENKALKRIFRLKREEVVEGWRTA
jgi:hypothetical protein